MSPPLRVRRCAILFLEPTHRLDLDVSSLLQGGTPLRRARCWVALSPHLDGSVELDRSAVHVLGELDEEEWLPWDALTKLHPADALSTLLEAGLLIGDHAAHDGIRERDALLREQYWHPLSAVAHYCMRWNNVGDGDESLLTRYRSMTELIDIHGAAPPHQIECSAPEVRIPLPIPQGTEIDRMIERRVTCRNFDLTRRLGADALGAMLRRMAGAFAEMELVPGAGVFKKAHPSGGGLHPTEVYVLVQRTDGIATGMYHYHAGQHALEPIRQMTDEEAYRAALSFVSEQSFFAEAHVLVALVPRFRRTFWKYRRHAKAYRTLVLEAGHMSQNMYIAATELGLGAWITAAINETQIEQAFGLDDIEQSPLAVCGFGIRAKEQTLYEFDPLQAVWPAQRPGQD